MEHHLRSSPRIKTEPSTSKRKGFTFFTAPEIEYFYFENANNPVPLDNAGYFDLTTLDLGAVYDAKH